MNKNFLKDYKKIKYVADVIEFMEALDEKLINSNFKNIGAFNSTYLIITKAVNTKVHDGFFNYPQIMERVDVIFSKYYFSAFDNYIRGKSVPIPWRTLFEISKINKHYKFIYMAMGVNAHVNNDLSQSLRDAKVNEKFYEDYQKVNGIIKQSIDVVIHSFDENNKVINELENKTQRIYSTILTSIIHNWREHAWNDFIKLKQSEINVKEIEEKSGYIAKKLSEIEALHNVTKINKIIRKE